MIRRKTIMQTDNINKKGGTNNTNAKVTVQYIQNQQMFHKADNTNINHNIEHSSIQDDLEIENVEYLEENANAEEYIEEHADREEFEDNFYPNAIQCLLDLYKGKYESLNIENSIAKVADLWRDLAKDMQERLFEFNEREIQYKFASLREQYFAVQSLEDIENFDYFEQLHDIYKDLNKENIAKGLNGGTNSPVYYKDEIFLQPEHLEINDSHMNNFKSEEITHKEHEFIDMVEKELQAIEDGVNIEHKESAGADITTKNDKKEILTNKFKNEETPRVKRTRVDTENFADPLRHNSKLNEFIVFNEVSGSACPSTKSQEFSLYLYNQEQERRHREKMLLLEKSLLIQERVFKQQQQLLQEIIKRFPS